MFIRSVSRRFASSPRRLEIQKFYTPSHEWIAFDAATKIATVGVSAHAQEQFGSVVYADLPEKGSTIEKDTPCGNVESVKATSEILSPVSGVIAEVNARVQENPAILNESPETDGWLLKVENARFEAAALMAPEKYAAFVETGKR